MWRLATSMRKILKLPGAKPRVQEKAMIAPPGCQDGFEASPSPVESMEISVPSRFIRQICCGPDRPETNTISPGDLGLIFGSTSIFGVLEIRLRFPPSGSVI